MKRGVLAPRGQDDWSLPSRGAWIETPSYGMGSTAYVSRSPHGERGLKLCPLRATRSAIPSLPSRGAWIETPAKKGGFSPGGSRSPHGERGLKRLPVLAFGCIASRSPHGERGLKHNLQGNPPSKLQRSLPSRGAWIETCIICLACPDGIVAPLTGSVD